MRVRGLITPRNARDDSVPDAADIIAYLGSSLGSAEEHVDRFSLNKLLAQWYFEPDFQAIRIVLGTIKAHSLPIGDPAWLFIVAPPGTGKTSMSIMSACGLPNVISISDLTENTFLSGFYGQREPGLLEKTGCTTQDGSTFITTGNAILLLKDFTTVLEMRREKRGVILSQFREIHDGEFKRHFGTGETKVWRGRATVVAAVTPILDRHYSIFSVLGERFLQIRWHRPQSELAGQWAIRQQGHEEEIRQAARKTVEDLFGASTNLSPRLSGLNETRLAALAEVVAIGRTHVYRSHFGAREIEYVPEPEANTRIAKTLASMAKGIASLNQKAEVTEQEMRDIFRVGFDCLPGYRREILLAALHYQPVESVKLPITVRRREVEAMQELGILKPLGLSLESKLQPTAKICKLLSTAVSNLDPMCSGEVN